MKTLFYSPKCNINCTDDEFFEKMEYASSLGADLIVFGEDAQTPYDELLRGADVLNGDEYNYLLESLYGFCFELGHGAVFCSTDDFGMRYSVFVNPFAEGGETFNKLYIKHCTQEGSVFELEDYDKCIGEIFQPIIYKGTKIGLTIGEDIFLPRLFERYRLNGVNTVINSFSGSVYMDNFAACAQDAACANNQMLLCGGFDGNAFAASPAKGITKATAVDCDLYQAETCNRDFAKKCGILQNDFASKYLPEQWKQKYNII